MAITVTDTAVQHLKTLAEKEGKPPVLRVGLRAGGCDGFSYVFDWGERREADTVIEKDGVTVLVDPKSLKLLDGGTLDFETGMMGHGLKFKAPQAKSTCGCGASVQF